MSLAPARERQPWAWLPASPRAGAHATSSGRADLQCLVGILGGGTPSSLVHPYQTKPGHLGAPSQSRVTVK